MKKKTVCIGLALLLAAGLAGMAFAGLFPFGRSKTYQSSTFSDVSSDAWYAPYVKSAYEYGLMQGTSGDRFSPDADISIAETLVLACRLHSAYAGDDHDFSSDSKTWYAPFVDYSVAEGITKKTQFASYEAAATRADFVTILDSALPEEARKSLTAIDSIPDVSPLAPYHDAVADFYSAGILAGKDDRGDFCPDQAITRAEACVILSKIVDPETRSAKVPQAWEAEKDQEAFDLSRVTAFTEFPYTVVNGGLPYFTSEELSGEAFETYSSLDDLGRCGVAYANVCPEIMPTEKRGSISSVKPTGWHTVRYDDLISDRYLFNRCHLVAYELAGENANPLNLITGTRYMNVSGMLPFENQVHDYVRETGNHVLYRVTPVFDGNDLVAEGVLMEAESVEDGGEGICWCVFCYNVQPGVSIDYRTGDSCSVKNYYLPTE